MLYEVTRQPRWNPAAFTDSIAMQESGRGSEELRHVLEELQHIELSELIAYTLGAAGEGQ